MHAFLRAVRLAVVPAIPAAHRVLEQAEAPLQAHSDEQEEALAETVAGQFRVDRVPMQEIVDFTDQAGEVFQRARDGAQTFEANVPWDTERRIIAAARADMAEQQETMAVDVPHLSEETLAEVNRHLQQAEALLASAQRDGEIPPQWQTLLRQLQEHYPSDPDEYDVGGYNPWDEWEDGRWAQ